VELRLGDDATGTFNQESLAPSDVMTTNQGRHEGEGSRSKGCT
jgi:hypothetical protein